MAQTLELLFNAAFRFFVRLASRLDPQVHFEIHDASRSPLKESFLQELAVFRMEAYGKRLPHLAEKFTVLVDSENSLDLRSIHVVARARHLWSGTGKIVAAVRFTPAPFEMEGFLEIEEPMRSDLEKETLEIGRLISNTRIPFVGRRLLFIGGEYVWSQTRFRALVAICRAERLPLFQSFGLKPISEPFWFDERQGHYSVIWGELKSVISTVRSSFKKRVREYARISSYPRAHRVLTAVGLTRRTPSLPGEQEKRG